ncbi:MAG: hypothetical protein H6557_27530 [Lewinellaceae bacterium]|nr:hypothetical protein [Lewinellaceae bacterium]
MLDPIRHIDPSSIKDMESLRDIVKLLLNIVEQQSDQLEQLRQENQELKDEINRLKGEQGRPKFPKAKEGAARDISSEKKRRKKNRKKGKRNLILGQALRRFAAVFECHQRSTELTPKSGNCSTISG